MSRASTIAEVESIDRKIDWLRCVTSLGALASVVGFVAGCVLLEWAIVLSCILSGIGFFRSRELFEQPLRERKKWLLEAVKNEDDDTVLAVVFE